MEAEASFANLPAPFRQRLELLVPPHCWDSVRATFSAPRRTALRVNRLLGDTAKVVQQLERDGLLLQTVPWYGDAFTIAPDQRTQLTHHPLVTSGEIYLHNLSSMAAALALEPQAGEMILDLAAAPGGKTLCLAALMQGQGALSAVESVRGRFFKLKENLKRGGAGYVRTFLMDGRDVAKKTGARFDRVLLDAPCSSEARFRAGDPTTFDKWSLRKVAECRRKQRALLRSAFHSLKPGGTLLYSTCSFSPEENEGVVASLLKKFSDQIQVEPLNLPFDNWQAGLTSWEGHHWPSELTAARRILPTADMDALFLVKLKKIASA